MFANTLIDNIRKLKRAYTIIDGTQRGTVIKNLLFLHDVVVASEQLLEEAGQSAALLPKTPFHERLVSYFQSHVEEERGELKVLQRDLSSAGVTPGVPNPLATAMVGTQYYLLKHVHPAALLGYMAVVEGDPVSLDTVQFFERAHGKELFRFLRLHAVKDLEHREELIEVIDSSPTSVRDLIVSSAGNTLKYVSEAAAEWRGESPDPLLRAGRATPLPGRRPEQTWCGGTWGICR
jgi:hypothetical protein